MGGIFDLKNILIKFGTQNLSLIAYQKYLKQAF